jgi:hypothetical protein
MFGRVAGTEMSNEEQLSDLDYRDFLEDLDSAGFEVTDWEARFIESNLTREVFTPDQRKSIDKMLQKYRRRMSGWSRI